jgi:hypothetical protein
MNKNSDLFPRNSEFSKVVKKARRKSLIKNILISLTVSVFLFIGFFWLGTFWMYKKVEKEISYDYAVHSVQGANVQISGSLYNYTPFSASVTTETQKNISDIPVPWEDQKKVFSILGSSRSIKSNFVSGIGDVSDKRTPLYFRGERVIEFYLPDENYEVLPDDRVLLDEIDENKMVEMAFSFDAVYGIEEVESEFTDGLNWYWVHTDTKVEKTEEVEAILGNQAYGFHTNRDSIESATRFIQQINWLREERGNFQREANRLYEFMTSEGQESLDVENIEIAGVVVTGTPEELKNFADEEMVRAAVLGVTTDKY